MATSSVTWRPSHLDANYRRVLRRSLRGRQMASVVYGRAASGYAPLLLYVLLYSVDL